MFVAPLCMHGWWGLSSGIFALNIAGASLAYKFAVSHTHDDLKIQPTTKDEYTDIDKWIRAQLADSISYGGLWTTFIFGGINMQVEHHIAPSLDPPLYHYLAPDIKRICKKYDVRYTYEPSFFHAVWRFHWKLWIMG